MKDKKCVILMSIWGGLTLVLVTFGVLYFITQKWNLLFYLLFLLGWLFSFSCAVLKFIRLKMGMEKQIVEISRYKEFADSRYRLMARLSDDVVFEYDLNHNTITDSTNWDRLADGIKFVEGTIEREIVHPEDAGVFKDYFYGPVKEGETKEAEIRLKTRLDGDYQWIQMRSIILGDSEGKPEKMIGRRTNVDKMRKEKDALKEQAERDLLTGLYNKMTSERLIEDCIHQAGVTSCVMLIIDIDYFKEYNDTLGHQAGDEILVRVAELVGNSFHGLGVKGRTGGDEFIAFLTDMGNDVISYVQNECLKFMRQLGEIELQQEYKKKITCSIGISIFPQDGETYYDLFQHADMALYHAKNSGRNCCKFYHPNRTEGE